MPHQLNLLPYPQRVTLHGQTVTLPESGTIALSVEHPADLFFTAQQAQNALAEFAGRQWPVAGGSFPAALAIRINPHVKLPESYRLETNDSGIDVIAGDAAGAFYGVMTLAQLLQTHGGTLPALVIEDWPDFAARGVMLDISRDRVPTMETLYRLVDLLASWKINQFQLYIEHTFAYRNHRPVWENASPMTHEEILALDAYCRARFIELVANQNSFAHMHRWFEHEAYMPLAEVDAPFLSPWGNVVPPYSLSPAVPETLDLIDELYDELLPQFSSRMFNVGCDETIDLGLGKSKALVAQHGKGRVYLDFLRKIYDRVTARGLTMQFWGDIINQYPELVPEIPKDTIALEWGYEADHDFPEKSKLFADSGVPFYVCPGTSSWRTIAGRTDNCTGNIRNAVENGLKHGAIGVLNTDWGDEGHWQPLPVSYLGFAYGAALSWAYEPNREIDLPAALDAFAFRDRAGVMGRLAYDLGNVYQIPGVLPPNSSVLFGAYHYPLEKYNAPEDLREKLNTTTREIERIMGALDRANMVVPDAELIKREFANAAHMLTHGAKRLLMQFEGSEIAPGDMRDDLAAIESEYREVWLARSRPGGLDDSAARMQRAGKLYNSA